MLLLDSLEVLVEKAHDHSRDFVRLELWGARTAEGLERIRRAVTKHGYYSKAAKLERARGRMLMRELRRLCSELGAG